MQTITLHNSFAQERASKVTSAAFTQWLQKISPQVIENRFGIVATLVLLQVSVAGFNVVVPAMAGASVYIMAPGIFMAFMSNSIAFAQMRMRWVLIGFALSLLINGIISLYYIIQLLQ